MVTEFKVEYDSRPDEVIDEISDILLQFGLNIVYVHSDNEADVYKVIKTQDDL